MRSLDFFMPDGPLVRALGRFEHRTSQLRMAAAVERTLDDGGVLLVEAGTGTGKTLAYLLPAILSGKKIVVSTGTKTLQDQIMEHDLPLLERALGEPIPAACVKGLGNYLCLRRLDELERSASAVEGPLARQLPQVIALRRRSETGDRAELAELGEDAEIWSHVTSSSESRIGARCAFFDECFVTRVRQRAEEARIVVVNHHLYFADLATRGPHGGGILPDHDAVIFDEAHRIEDVVTQFFGVTVSTTRLDVLVRDAERALRAAKLADGSAQLLREVLQATSLFFAALPRETGREGSRAELLREAFSGDLQAGMLRLDAALDALASFARRNAGAGEAVMQTARRAEQLREDVARVAEGGKGTHVTWTEARGRRVSIGASPVDVSTLLRDELFYRMPAVILTSATLSTSRSFDFVKQRLGIDFPASEELLESPFDYESQAALYLPAELPDPRDPSWLDAVNDEILGLVDLTSGGAFVLCTSIRAMTELAKRARMLVAQPVLVQGEAPKPALLSRFKEHGDAVLFATSSFWEGVDVPGRALRLVVIDKLPFDVPSDPLVRARLARIEEAGETPFMKYLVPSAALSLKQGFGRLVRTADDRGIVAILDSRVVKKGYGRVFLSSLPPARRCTTLDEVKAFYEARA